jgi:glycosyltransferase involved in cell wall biosynthesis
MKANVTDSVSLSLIVATVGRTDELVRLIQSVAAQKLSQIELIIVDQNADERVETLLHQAAPTLRYTHIRCLPGLSRARNVGLLRASGAILGFPDDDCWYPEDLLQQVKNWFDRYPERQFLCCALRDETGQEVAARWPARSQSLDRNSVLRAAASAALFVRRDMAWQVGGFDEEIGLGAGTPFQSGEDTDYALRCLRAGGTGWFEKELYVCHPKREPALMSHSRAYAYGMGFGYILGKHGYATSPVAYHVARAAAGAVKSTLLLRTAEAGFYFQSARGRWNGYLACKMQQKD